jgi:hypothetical protein
MTDIIGYRFMRRHSMQETAVAPSLRLFAQLGWSLPAVRIIVKVEICREKHGGA